MLVKRSFAMGFWIRAAAVFSLIGFGVGVLVSTGEIRAEPGNFVITGKPNKYLEEIKLDLTDSYESVQNTIDKLADDRPLASIGVRKISPNDAAEALKLQHLAKYDSDELDETLTDLMDKNLKSPQHRCGDHGFISVSIALEMMKASSASGKDLSRIATTYRARCSKPSELTNEECMELVKTQAVSGEKFERLKKASLDLYNESCSILSCVLNLEQAVELVKFNTVFKGHKTNAELVEMVRGMYSSFILEPFSKDDKVEFVKTCLATRKTPAEIKDLYEGSFELPFNSARNAEIIKLAAFTSQGANDLHSLAGEVAGWSVFRPDGISKENSVEAVKLAFTKIAENDAAMQKLLLVDHHMNSAESLRICKIVSEIPEPTEKKPRVNIDPNGLPATKVKGSR
ncbi:MAG: hypothetical protein C5B49_02370 [Bdellovibrio sp.]|nr:MAG: hypothetical protein C5B49_02370 [Bdellovibrio sp.]